MSLYQDEPGDSKEVKETKPWTAERAVQVYEILAEHLVDAARTIEDDAKRQEIQKKLDKYEGSVASVTESFQAGAIGEKEAIDLIVKVADGVEADLALAGKTVTIDGLNADLKPNVGFLPLLMMALPLLSKLGGKKKKAKAAAPQYAAPPPPAPKKPPYLIIGIIAAAVVIPVGILLLSGGGGGDSYDRDRRGRR
jgi:hypothetical protein